MSQAGDIEQLLETFDVPVRRKLLTGDRAIRADNLRWLLRNIGINNQDNPDLERVKSLIKSLVREQVGGV